MTQFVYLVLYKTVNITFLHTGHKGRLLKREEEEVLHKKSQLLFNPLLSFPTGSSDVQGF